MLSLERSLSFIAICLELGCASGPELTSCTFDGKNLMMHCYDPAARHLSAIAGKDADHYICRAPEDEQKLLNYCAGRQR